MGWMKILPNQVWGKLCWLKIHADDLFNYYVVGCSRLEEDSSKSG